MNDQDTILKTFSIAFIMLCSTYVLVRFLTKKSDLFTTNNLFILGSAIFIGLSGLNSVNSGHFFSYSKTTFIRFYAANIIFYTTYLATYHKFRLPVRMAERRAISWPFPTKTGLYTILVVSLMLFAAQTLTVQIPGIGRLLLVIAIIAPGFAVVFSFHAWVRDRKKPLSWLILGFTTILSIVSLFAEGGGRRALYSALFAIPFCVYWSFLRSKSPFTVIFTFAVFSIPAISFDLAYGSVRWQGTNRSTYEIEGAGERFKLLKDKLQDIQNSGIDKIARISQTGVEYSLVAIHLYTDPRAGFEIQPFHSVYTLLTVPIPRALWPDKPLHIGMTLPFDSGTIRRDVTTNIGPGIAGHVYHEGGLPMAVFYGFLMGFALRFIDSILITRLNDPVFLGFVAASAFHIIGWSRGSIFTFTFSPLLSYFMMLAYIQILRLPNLGVYKRGALYAADSMPHNRLP